jgi:hypothetical protein
MPTDYNWSTQYCPHPQLTLCAHLQFLLLSMSILTELEDTWKSSNFQSRSKPMVACKKCTKPKRKGGMGIINLRTQNQALLIKHLDKFYNRRDILWVNMIWSSHYPNGEVPHATKEKGSFWWRDVLKLVDHFRGIDACKIGDEKTILFWSDV